MKTWKSSSWIGLLTLSSVLLTGMQCSEYEASPQLRKKWDLADFGARGRLNVCVIDESGLPISDASVKTSYNLYKRPLIWCLTGDLEVVDGPRPSGTTDKNGRWHMEGQMPISGRLFVEKEGFYKKTEIFRFEDKTQLNSERGRWVPYERRKIVEMKRIVDPQPFYGVLRSYDRKIPVLDRPLGYDLRLGEFLPPYGKGEVADMTVTATCQCAPDAYFADAYTLTFAFPRPGDGIVRLEKDMSTPLRSPQTVPDGLKWEKEMLVDTFSRDKGGEYIRESEWLLLRVRSELDEHGNVTKANYVKIYGPLSYGSRRWKPGKPRMSMLFTSIFFPDATSKGLEPDPDRNLLRKLYPISYSNAAPTKTAGAMFEL